MSLADTLLAPPLRVANSMIGEGPWKNRVRAAMLRVRNGLPREVMVRRGDRVVQVGMWRRRNLHRLSRCVGPTGSVILIEADPRVVSDLRPYIEQNRLNNVTVVNKGAFHTPGELEFKVAKTPGHNRLDSTESVMLNEVDRDVFEGVTKIPVDRVDNILAELNATRVDYAEVTVNGLEREVLQGMTETLKRVQRVFVAGYARTGEGDPTNRAIESLLNDSGLKTIISRKTPPTQEDFSEKAAREWGWQEGHVFAWRETVR